MRKLALLLTLACLFFPAFSARADSLPLNVYFAGQDGGMRTALELDRDAHFTSDPAQADVFVLNGKIPAANAAAIRTRVRGGAGLILILGTDLTAGPVGDLLGSPVTLMKKDDPLSLAPVATTQDSVVKSVIWDSAPQVRERFTLTGSNLDPLVTGFGDGSLVLGSQRIGSGQAFVLTAFLDSTNLEFQ